MNFGTLEDVQFFEEDLDGTLGDGNHEADMEFMETCRDYTRNSKWRVHSMQKRRTAGSE
jgi:hypothetical protein